MNVYGIELTGGSNLNDVGYIVIGKICCVPSSSYTIKSKVNGKNIGRVAKLL